MRTGMARSSDHQRARYVYAITEPAGERVYGTIGLDGATVYTLPQGSLAAVVSDIREKKLRPERGKLGAHHAVVTRVMAEGPVLPVAFGTIAESAQAVRTLLAEGQEVFTEQLRRVRGKVEMALRVAWDVPNIFEYFVNRHPELAALRDELLGRQHGPTQEDKIELGRLFDRLLSQEREAHAETVMETLAPCCAEIHQNQPRNEQEVMHLACLIRREDQKRFEDGVFEAAKRFDNNFAFDFNGPWAPHHFVNVALEA